MTAKTVETSSFTFRSSVKNYIGEINYFETNLIEGSRKRLQEMPHTAGAGRELWETAGEPAGDAGERVNYMTGAASHK